MTWDSEFEYDGDPAHRGHAGLLFLRALQHAGALFGAGPSASVRPLLAAAGFTFVRVDRYVAVIHSVAYLARLRGPIPLRLAAPAIDGLVGVERRIRLLGTPEVGLMPVDRFDERVRGFEVQRGHCAFYRDDIELNWVLSRPWLPTDYRYLPYLVHHSGEVVGFALARIRRHGGRVVATVMRTGLATGDDTLTDRLIATLVRRLAETADVVDLHTNQERVARAALRAGMRRRGGFEISAKTSVAIDARLRSANCDLRRMPLEFGEGDVIFA